MLKNGSWATEKFKEYNLDAKGTQPKGGTLHPLLKVRKEFREIFLELGFEATMPPCLTPNPKPNPNPNSCHQTSQHP